MTANTRRVCFKIGAHWQSSLPLLLLTMMTSLVGCNRDWSAHRSERPSRELSAGRSGDVAGSATAAANIEFIDATEQSGVRSVYQSGKDAGEFTILEGLGGGVAMLDYDADGRLDLLFASGGKIVKDQPLVGLPSTLWRNRGPAQFDRVESSARIDAAPHYSHGLASADYDNDGFTDVLLTGYGGLQLFHNQGDGTYCQVAHQARLSDTSWSTSAAWLDQNGDGNLDLYVAHYVNWSWSNNPKCGAPAARDACTPYDFEGLDDTLYLSQGDGSFADRGRELGLIEGGKGLGVVAADFDLDGRTDVYVANDTTNNFLYKNQADAKLVEIGLNSATAVDERGIPNGSMGLAVFDFDLDLKPDIWVTNFENETCAMYKNEGDGNFRCITKSTGINALGTVYVGFGTVAADLDGDGYEDLAVANGHLQNYAPLAQDQLLLRNERGKRLRRVESTADSYFAQKHIGRGLAVGDLDADGRLDLVFSNSMEPAAVLLNRSGGGGRQPTSVSLRLVGTRANRDAIGCSVILETSSGQQFRQVCGGGSYLSQNPYVLTWALPNGVQAKQASILWPGNQRQNVQIGLADQLIVVQPDPE